MINYPKVAVVILNWNGRYFLENFLPSVYNSSYPNIEFVVGDNGSTDSSMEFVAKTYPKIRLIYNEENQGFAKGYNTILESVEADYFVLLNSDIEVSNNWIEPIIDFMEIRLDVAVVQPKILSWHRKGTFEYAGAAGGFIDRFGYPFCRGRIFEKVEKDEGQYNDSGEVFWASGAAFFIRSKCWKESGGFDSDYFAHMEEIDLCWRLKRMGHKIWYCSSSEVYHVGGGSLKKEDPFKTYLNFKNNLMMLQKNLPPIKGFALIFVRLWLDLLAMIRFIINRKFKDAYAIHKAHWHFFTSFAKTNRKRKQLASGFTVDLIYRRSILWDYFVKGKNRFSELNTKYFSRRQP